MVNVSRSILVSAPRDSVRQYLQDLRNMEHYGPKVQAVQVEQEGAESGLVEVDGRFMGLPWKGAFKAQFTRDGGVRLEMLRGPLPGLCGGFHLRAVAGGTVITHDQSCDCPLFLKPLAPLFKRLLRDSMDRQLYAIKEGAEYLHRQLQIRQIESV